MPRRLDPVVRGFNKAHQWVHRAEARAGRHLPVIVLEPAP